MNDNTWIRLLAGVGALTIVAFLVGSLVEYLNFGFIFSLFITTIVVAGVVLMKRR